MGWVVSVLPRPRSSPGERTPGTHCNGGWVGLRAGQDTKAWGQILCHSCGSNPVVQSVRHYTSCASPALIKWKAKLKFEVARILLDIPQKTSPKLRIFVRFITMTSEIRNNHYNGITEHTKLKTKSVMTSSSTIFFFFFTMALQPIFETGPPLYWVFLITYNQTHGRTPLDEWSASCRELYLHRTTQHPCPPRDSNQRSQQPSGQDLRLRPRGHRDRQNNIHTKFKKKNFKYFRSNQDNTLWAIIK
jgi:hypothetical protein